MKYNSDYPHFEIKTTNQVFIDTDGICKTRIWGVGKGQVQVMSVIISDRKTTENYTRHLDRKSQCWSHDDEPPKIPHGGSNINNRTEESAFSSKRGW